ncbi:hypothetical protein CHX26_01165 [Porphyrobacter sp. HT-58-2]|uniref:hypothetical protein n=1 Tax=Porphyrobacter sp. HT-58-2 TaxID=2023229 RepID=UPI000CDC06BD|nr:hypothetical protein [Porphyrobacter sp. HT-58-2]AUX68311.1 hypothetical protein CHX26_01165 [Porphyrobacter sp. HT-58-2]
MTPAGGSAVHAALAGDPVLAEHYAEFRAKSEAALDPALVALIRQAVAAVHGMGAAPDESTLDQGTRLCLAYARRMPFEHTAITDAEAAAVVAHLGEPGYVAFSVVTALADAECRAALVDLPGLATL